MEVSTTMEVPVGVIEVTTSSIEEFVSTTGTVYPLKEVTLSLGDYRGYTGFRSIRPPVNHMPWVIV